MDHQMYFTGKYNIISPMITKYIPTIKHCICNPMDHQVYSKVKYCIWPQPWISKCILRLNIAFAPQWISKCIFYTSYTIFMLTDVYIFLIFQANEKKCMTPYPMTLAQR